MNINDLSQFTGSGIFTRWSILFRGSVLTEGALYVAEKCGAYWLMDAIASHQTSAKVRGEDFQTWELSKKGGGWVLLATDGNGNRIARQALEYSSFPLDDIKFFAVRNELGGVTIMLPSEY